MSSITFWSAGDICLPFHEAFFNSSGVESVALSTLPTNSGDMCSRVILGDGGHNIMVLPGSVSPQLVHSICQRLLVRKIHPQQHQAEILGKAAEKLVDEEDVALLAPGADPQHLRKKLRRFLSSQGHHLLDELHLLIISELTSCQEPGLQLCVRFSKQQRRRHEIRQEVDCGLRQGGENVVVPDELIFDATQDELRPSAMANQEMMLLGQERQLDVLVVRRPRWCFSICHLVVGSVLCIRRLPLVGINDYN
jgi:hypothetical protein